MKLGAYVNNIYSGIHVQADDIALIATSHADLQKMIDLVYNYACKWRFLLHPGKTKIMVFNESQFFSKINVPFRKWRVGDVICSETDSHKHCGTVLTTASTTVARTKDICKKGRGIMLSIINKLSNQAFINPMVMLKLYKSIVLPSALFGCELWCHQSKTEKEMLERLQRFCVKSIQHLGKRTHTNISSPMLGLSPLVSYMDAVKLKFLRRVLESHKSTSNRILTMCLFVDQIYPGFTRGITGEMITICKKYELMEHVNHYLKDGVFPEKRPWKYIIEDKIKNTVYKKFNNQTTEDDYKRFKCIHPDPPQVNPVWSVAKAKPYMVHICMQVAKLIAYPSYNELLCEFCGSLNEDILLHCAMHCPKTKEERDDMWDILINKLDVDQSVYLHSLEDDEFLSVLMGGPCKVFECIEDHIDFLIISYTFLNKMCTTSNLLQLILHNT